MTTATLALIQVVNATLAALEAAEITWSLQRIVAATSAAPGG